MCEISSGRVPAEPGSCRSGDAATASSSLRDGDPSRNEALISEAANFEEMAKYSRMVSFKRACLGDPEGVAFWRGRARGLELAAINMRAAASGIEIPKGPGSESPAEGESPVGGNAEAPNPLPQNHHDRSGTGSEVKED